MDSSSVDLRLASAAEDVKIWESDNHASLYHLPTDGIAVKSVCWSCDLQKIVCVPTKRHHVMLTVFKADSPEIEDVHIRQEPTCVQFSNSSASVFSAGCKNGKVLIWDLKQKKAIKTFSTENREITCLQFSRNNSYIASGSSNGKIYLHNCTTGQSNTPFGLSGDHSIQSLHYSYFQKSLIGSAHYDGTVTLWNSNTRQPSHSFPGAHVAPATGLRFSPINPLLIISVGLDKKICCYDAKSKGIAKSFDCAFPITCFDFKQDGHTLALGSTRGKVLIYDLRFLNSARDIIAAHATAVNCLSFQNVLLAASKEKKSRRVDSSKCEAISLASDVTKDVLNLSLSFEEEPSIGGCRKSNIFDIFSPIRETSNSCASGDSVSFNTSLKKSPKVCEDSLTVFSPLGLKLTPGLKNASVGSANSPMLRERSEFYLKPSDSPTVNLVDFKTRQDTMKTEHLLGLSSDSSDVFAKVNSAEGISPVTNKMNFKPTEADAVRSEHILLAPGDSEDRSARSGEQVKWSSEDADHEVPCMPDLSCLNLGNMCSLNPGSIGKDDSSARCEQPYFSEIPGASPRSEQPITEILPSIVVTSSQGNDIAKAKLSFSKDVESIDEGQGTSVGTTPVTPEAFQAEYIRQCVSDMMEENLDEYRKLFHHQHLMMCKQTEELRDFMESLFVRYSVNRDLAAEVQRLHKQNQMLKRLFH